VRVVLDFKSVKEHQIFYLRDPMRLVIDVKGTRPALSAAAPPRPNPNPSNAPLETVRVADQQPVPEAEPIEQITGSRRITGMAAPDPKPVPTRKPATRIVLEGNAVPEPKPTPTPTAVANAPQAPAAPQSNRSGQYSLARQLGLGARRIVIDAGHGGHDPGTIGNAGLQEKDLVLDVALRLDRMVREELRADVVMTRATDVFIPLEERTAIANAKGADLFLSIHANSARNTAARGIETYFLNFAKNPHAEEVAARENAISPATLKDLQTLVKAITLNSKIDESRDFAASIQEALIQGMKARDPSIPDRGVHTAPFYVLIGANMPSILAEIAFVSNPNDERMLKTGEYREAIARSLFLGVRSYLDSLNRSNKFSPTLTSAPQRTLTPPAGRPRVAERSKSR
jgi:N-acetylmuramoyl-L-alanine amidase